MTAVVLDASAFIEAALRTRRGRRVAELLADATWHVPGHFDAEVFGVYARLHRRGLLTEGQVTELLGDLMAVELIRHPVTSVLQGAWSWIGDLSPRDALYAELARRLATPLLTCDAGLATRSPGAVFVDGGGYL